MAKPVVLVVDDEADSLRALTQELTSRYGAHYRIVASASAQDALATLAELRAEEAAVPLILADQWMPETTGIELLARTRELHPTARRGADLLGRPVGQRRSWRPRRSGRSSSTCLRRRGPRTRSSIWR